MRCSTVVSALASYATIASAALSPLHITGSKFFDSNGNQVFFKGIAYQLEPSDPLIDTTQCKLDAALMQTVGANSIRVYHVDPKANHDGCMAAFENAGIYLFLDLDTFNTAIDQAQPHWNQTQLTAFTDVLDAFHNYNNLAGVFVGNEIMTTGQYSFVAPYIKAAARDVKAYRDGKNYRNIPVGYSAADIASLRPMLQNYLACGGNSSETIDFFALNAYEWCGASTYATSGYTNLQADAEAYSLPIFFSETGCNTPAPRTFADQSAILGTEMNGVWSGAIIYEWIEEANNYGLISYGPQVAATAVNAPPDGFTRSGTPTPVQPDFSNLSNQWATLSPTGVKESAYDTATITAPACPAQTSGVWDVNGNPALPSLGQVLDVNSITGSDAPQATATASASASATKQGGASPEREVQAGAVGLGVVMAVAIAWL